MSFAISLHKKNTRTRKSIKIMIDYTAIYDLLKSRYGTLQKIADAIGVHRNSITNVLLERTKNGPNAPLIRETAAKYAAEILSEEKKRIEEIVKERDVINEAAALLAATN